MTKTYMKCEEVKVPDEILTKLEKSSAMGQPMTFGEAGVFDWINKKAEEGWRVVWQAFNFPFLVFEREVVVEEVEN